VSAAQDLILYLVLDQDWRNPEVIRDGAQVFLYSLARRKWQLDPDSFGRSEQLGRERAPDLLQVSV